MRAIVKTHGVCTIHYSNVAFNTVTSNNASGAQTFCTLAFLPRTRSEQRKINICRGSRAVLIIAEKARSPIAGLTGCWLRQRLYLLLWLMVHLNARYVPTVFLPVRIRCIIQWHVPYYLRRVRSARALFSDYALICFGKSSLKLRDSIARACASLLLQSRWPESNPGSCFGRSFFLLVLRPSYGLAPHSMISSRAGALTHTTARNIVVGSHRRVHFLSLRFVFRSHAGAVRFRATVRRTPAGFRRRDCCSKKITAEKRDCDRGLRNKL